MTITGNFILCFIIGILIAAIILLVFQMLSLRAKMSRINKKYNYFMTGENGISLERKLSVEIRELRDMTRSAEDMIQQEQALFNTQNFSFQKIGLIRYDAFDDTGDKLSFSLTIMDGMNNGFILSSLVGRDNSRIYAKRIIEGQCRDALSSEEAESINIALQSRGEGVPSVTASYESHPKSGEADKNEEEFRRLPLVPDTEEQKKTGE